MVDVRFVLRHLHDQARRAWQQVQRAAAVDRATASTTVEELRQRLDDLRPRLDELDWITGRVAETVDSFVQRQQARVWQDLRDFIAPTEDELPDAVAAFDLGTLAGLVVKYVLDKRWIFDDRSTGLRAHGQRFGLYTIMGLVTTAIFWGTETAFWLTWRTDAMRELGAVLGLTVGYVVKYRLDRRFVFTSGGAHA